MNLQARIQTRRWREGNPEEQEQHLIESRREMFLDPEGMNTGMGTVLFFGVVGLFFWYILPIMVGDLSGDPALVEAISGVFVLPIIFLTAMAYWLRQKLIQRMARWDALVKLLVSWDKFMGTPTALIDCHVEESFTTPIDIEIDTDGERPALRWRPSGPEVLETTRIVDTGPDTALPQGARRPLNATGEVSLAESSRPSFDLTRSSERDDILYLACRSQTPGEEVDQLSLILRRPAWMGDDQFERLPVMVREGAWLSEDDSEDLLRFISQISTELGRPVEALAEQTEPAYVVTA